MSRILYHVDFLDGEEIPDDAVPNGLFQRCDPIELSDGRTGLRYYFIKDVSKPNAD